MDLEKERTYSNGSHGGGRRITEVQIDGAVSLLCLIDNRMLAAVSMAVVSLCWCFSSLSHSSVVHHPGNHHRSTLMSLPSYRHNNKALLRIVKHCEDSLPAQSTGALLGLDVSRGEGQGTVMQISYAFALPRGRDGGYNDGQVGMYLSLPFPLQPTLFTSKPLDMYYIG